MPTDLGTETPFDKQAAKVDVWDAGPDQYAQEPIFCPKPGAKEEDDGWIFTMVYDTLTDRSQLAILNAQDLEAGPIARIKLPHKIPFGELDLYCNHRSLRVVVVEICIYLPTTFSPQGPAYPV